MNTPSAGMVVLSDSNQKAVKPEYTDPKNEYSWYFDSLHSTKNRKWSNCVQLLYSFSYVQFISNVYVYRKWIN